MIPRMGSTGRSALLTFNNMTRYYLIGVIIGALLIPGRAELPRYTVEKIDVPIRSRSLNEAGEVRADGYFFGTQDLYTAAGTRISSLNMTPAGWDAVFIAGNGNLTNAGTTPVGLVQEGGIQSVGIGDFRTGQIRVLPDTPDNADSDLRPRISPANDYVVVMAGPAVGQLQPYRYQSSTGWQALGQLTPGEDSRPLAVNASGSVVGWAEDEDEEERPFLYTNAGGLVPITNGDERLFGQATAINNHGLVAGTANGRAFVFNGSTMEFTYVTESITGWRALDINSAGAIIGANDASGGGGFGVPSGSAFYWDSENGAASFDNLIGTAIDDWFITDAVNITDNGWVLGTGYERSTGFHHQILLRPVPEPSALVLLSAAAGLAWLRRWRKIR